MTMTSAAVTCGVCGMNAPSYPPPLSWSAAVRDGQRDWTCDRCAREHIRSIEGHLDPALW
ncbi:MAG TPA: hypothetical protein VFP72_23020 [Kineosporiaceae bacterium]|nr:hypothetical protein [Kineosporiaceae bacterium]